MKKLAILFSVCVLITVTAFDLSAQAGYTVKASKMTVTGTSSLHEWETEVTKVTADAKMKVAAGKLEDISSLTVTVAAKGLKSKHGKVMDDKTYEALKADANPNITFQLTDVESITAANGGYTIKAKGNLTIAGSKKPVSMSVTANVASNGAVTFKGSKKVSMPDHGMTPPKAVMGTIKVGPEVTVGFEVTLAPAS